MRRTSARPAAASPVIAPTWSTSCSMLGTEPLPATYTGAPTACESRAAAAAEVLFGARMRSGWSLRSRAMLGDPSAAVARGSRSAAAGYCSRPLAGDDRPAGADRVRGLGQARVQRHHPARLRLHRHPPAEPVGDALRKRGQRADRLRLEPATGGDEQRDQHGQRAETVHGREILDSVPCMRAR